MEKNDTNLTLLGITYSEPIQTSEEVKGETPPYRYAGMTAQDTLNDCMPNGDKDLNRLIESSVREFAKNPCLGTREKKTEEKKDEEGNVKSKCYSLHKF